MRVGSRAVLTNKPQHGKAPVEQSCPYTLADRYPHTLNEYDKAPPVAACTCHPRPNLKPFFAHRWQKSIADKLKPIEVDASDKSVEAYLTRARNAVLKGVNHDIHDEIADDVDLTAVRVCCCQQQALSVLGFYSRCCCCAGHLVGS